MPSLSPPSSEHPYLWRYLVPFIFVVFWSSGFAFAKMGLDHAGPFMLLALRYLLVLAVLLPVYLVLRPPLPRTRQQWQHQFVVGVLIQVLYFVCAYTAIVHGVSASGMALIFSMQPILVGLLAPRLTGERINRRCWFGLGLGLLGAALVIFGRAQVDIASPFAYAVAAGAVLSMTAATLYEKRFGSHIHPISANFIQGGVGLLCTLPLAYLLENFTVRWSAELWGTLAYLVICNSLIAISLLLAMIRRGTAARVSALFFLVPPTAALVAWSLIGETIPPLAWVGMFTAATGVALVTWTPRPKPAQSL